MARLGVWHGIRYHYQRLKKMSDRQTFENLYDEKLVPLLLEMDVEQYSYFSLGVCLAILTASCAILKGENLLDIMNQIETDVMRFDREALATRMLMLAAFLDELKNREKD
jgi:hypothetical protein